MFRVAVRGGLPSCRSIPPAMNQAAIIPTPYGQDSEESYPSRKRDRGQEAGPSWCFRGLPLVLDVFPGTSRAGRDLEGREVHLKRQGPRAARRPPSRLTAEMPVMVVA